MDELTRDIQRYAPHAPTEDHVTLFASLPDTERAIILELIGILREVDFTAPKVMTVGNVKGGVGKTTTTIYQAIIFSFVLPKILIIDADGENKQSLGWASLSNAWPSNIRVVPWAGEDPRNGQKITPADLENNLAHQVAQAKFQLIIIDTGPQIREYLIAALKHSSEFVITTSHRPLDKAKVMDSVDLAAETVARTGKELNATILITDTNPAAAEHRELVGRLDRQRVPRFETFIPNRETISNAALLGMPKRFDEYLSVARQLALMWAGAWEWTWPDLEEQGEVEQPA